MSVALAVLAFGRLGWTARGWRLLPLLIALALIVVLDLQSRVIPDVLTLPGIAYALGLAVAVEGLAGLVAAGIGALMAGAAVLLLAIVSRGGIGGGDIKLAAMLGALLGWKEALLTLALSQVVAGIVVLVLVVVRGRPERPFPVGALIAVLGGLLLIGHA